VIKAILFDAAGTLFYLTKTVGDDCANEKTDVTVVEGCSKETR
jgi:hypothetical protein